MRHRLWLAALLLAVVPCLGAETAQEREVTVHLKDGSTLVGKIVSEDEARLKVVTRAGVEVEVPRATVASIEEAGKAAAKPPAEPVVDDTRLFFGPTGRPLRKGAGYFSDHEIFFPGVAYGEGLPFLPWLSFSYHFSSPRPGK